jgi:hypothetical protein
MSGDLCLKSGLGPPDGRVSLQSQSHDRPPADSDCAELVSALVSTRLGAPLPLMLDEHLPAASLIGHTAFRHPASYLTRHRGGKVGGNRSRTDDHGFLCGVPQAGALMDGRATRCSAMCNSIGLNCRQRLSPLRVCSLSLLA